MTQIPIGKLSNLFRKFYVFLRQDKKLIILNVFIMTLSVVIGAILIWMVGKGVDSLIKGNMSTMVVYLLGFSSLILFLQVLRYINYFLYELMQQHVIFAIRRKLYTHILALSTPFTNKQSTGDLLTRLGHDVSRISHLLVLVPGSIFGFMLTSILYITILFYIDQVLAILSLSLTPLFLLHQRLFLAKTRKTAREYLYREGCMGGFEAESLNNVQGIVSYNAENTMIMRFDSIFKKFKKAAMSNLMLNNLFVVSFELLAAFIAIIILTMGIYRTSHAYLSVGELVNFLLYLGYMVVPVRGLARLPIESQTNAAAAERVGCILDEIPIVESKPDSIILDNSCKRLQLHNVNFSYEANKNIISDFNIDISPNEFIAITGPSGSGKSTIAKLLLRFYDPVSGEILWGNTNLKEINLQSLRSQIAIVMQNNFIIDDTVSENIRLGNPKASMSEVINAAKNANADEFINRLQNGYDTRLGGNGNLLSEGQKQRIALAQAFIKKAPLLILDEATSSLDSESEKLILQSFEKMRNKCTSIVIAHRYSTIASADRVIYLNKDMSVTIGTHNELVSSCRPYKNNLKHQFNIPM